MEGDVEVARRILEYNFRGTCPETLCPFPSRWKKGWQKKWKVEYMKTEDTRRESEWCTLDTFVDHAHFAVGSGERADTAPQLPALDNLRGE
jgi:hypothetical protein